MLDSVKISDLALSAFSNAKDRDLFLKVHFNYMDVEKEELDEIDPYDSKAVELSSIVGSMLQRNRVVRSKWTFLNPQPKSTVRLDPKNFYKNYIVNKDNRNDVARLTGNGNYSKNSTFFPSSLSSTTLEATDVSQYSVANLDYVNRMAALLFDYWMEKLKDTMELLNKQAIVPSTVGDCIFSTTLNTEAKVKSYYGDGQRILFEFGDIVIRAPNTSWIQHTGNYFFGDWGSKKGRAAGIAGKRFEIGAKNDDGSPKRKIKLTKDNLKQHTHTIAGHSHSGKLSGSTGQFVVSVSFGKCGTRIESGHKPFLDYRGGSHDSYNPVPLSPASITFKGSVKVKGCGDQTSSSFGKGYTLNFEQAYKNVYVWERV